jgi:selenocysteine-specific elongation factor
VIAPPGRAVVLSPAQGTAAQRFLSELSAAPYAPQPSIVPDADLLAYLTEAGEIVPVAEGVVFAASAYRSMVEQIVEHIRSNGTITLAQVRDLFGTSRKYAQALLEHMDEQRITRRVGDERVLR